SFRAAHSTRFFICPLGFRVGFGDDRSGLAPPKAHLPEHPLTLAHSQMEAEGALDMVAEQFAVPESLKVAQRTRRGAQVPSNALAHRRIQGARTPWTRSFLQSGKSALLKT